jgi:hypothetical protein
MKSLNQKIQMNEVYSVRDPGKKYYVAKKHEDIFKNDYNSSSKYSETNIMIPNQQTPQPKMFSIAEVRELVAKAWEDGYTTSSGDSFHSKNTPYGKSDFFKEFYAKYNKD